MQDPSPYPEITIYTAYAAAALEAGLSAEYWLYGQLKAWDVTYCNGQGWISSSLAWEHYQRVTGHNRRTFQRKIKRLIDLGWITDDNRNRKNRRFFLANHAKVAATFQAERTYTKYKAHHRVIRSKTEYKALAYEALLQSREGKPIGRRTITRITGLSPSTQRRYEKQRGIKVESNEWDTKIPFFSDEPEHKIVVHELRWDYGYAVYPGKTNKKAAPTIRIRLPNSFIVTGILAEARRGMMKQHNAALDLLVYGEEGNERPKRKKLYHDDQGKAQKATNRHKEELFYPRSRKRYRIDTSKKTKLAGINVWLRT